jgi:8-oxo-dGTP diphosphatase
MQFGGHIELKETPWQALAHELREESGYDIDELNIILSPPKIGLLDTDEHYAPFSMNTHAFDKDNTHFHTDAAYAFIAQDEPSASRAEGESEELKWLTREELLQLPATEIFSNVKQLGLFVLAAAARAQGDSTNI